MAAETDRLRKDMDAARARVEGLQQAAAETEAAHVKADAAINEADSENIDEPLRVRASAREKLVAIRQALDGARPVLHAAERAYGAARHRELVAERAAAVGALTLAVGAAMAPLHPAAEKIARMGAELDGLHLPPGVVHTGEPSLSSADAVLRTLIAWASLHGDGSGVEVRFKVSQAWSTSPAPGLASGRHYRAGEVVRVPVEAADLLTCQKIAEIVTAARA